MTTRSFYTQPQQLNCHGHGTLYLNLPTPTETCLQTEPATRTACSYPPRRTWQLGILFSLIPGRSPLKYLNSATELLNDLVAQLARAWQAIC